MSSLLQRLREQSPGRTLLIGALVFLVYAFPGYMSNDSVAQLREARAGVFSDAHPPVMAAEWWLLDRIISGPILMLLLQATLFLGALYVLLRRYLSARSAAWVAIAILLFPPVLTPMAVIWKDSQMAAYLLAGVAALLQPRLRVRIAGLALLAVACALRHNAIAAVIPLVFFLFEWRAGVRWWKRAAILIAAMLLTVAATIGITRMLTSQHVKLTPVFTDILGVLAFSDERPDAELQEVLRGTPLVVTTGIQARARLLFEQRGPWRITKGDERLFDYPDTPEEWSAMSRAWKELVLGDFGAYLASHWATFSLLIGYDEQPPRAAAWNLFLETHEAVPYVEHLATWSYAQYWIGQRFYWLADHTPLFRPYVYVAIALLLLALCCRDRVTLGLFASGLLYELSFFPPSADPDYRYSHWMIVTVCVATVILYIQRRRRRPAT